MKMPDHEYDHPVEIRVDEERTGQALAAWQAELRRRLQADWENLSDGQPFRGLKTDPNEAYVVGLMQKCFLTLAMEPACEIRAVPALNSRLPYVEGEIDVFEGGLGKEGLNALKTLGLISDAVVTGETDCGWYSISKMRFTLHGVWERYSFPGGASEAWIKQLI